MNFRCAILDDYQNAALTGVEKSALPAGVEFVGFHDHLDDPAALSRRLEAFHAVILMRERTPLPADVLAKLPQLKLIVTTGMRNASIDLAAAKQRGITVCGTGSSSEPPTELTWALILAARRHLPTETLALATGGAWQSTLGEDLCGQTLGLVGLGKIGSRMARIANAFGMKVVAWSPHLSDERAAEVGVERAGLLEDLLERSDIVSVHLGLGANTRGLLGRQQFARMKPTALFVNTSRAALVEPGALLDALDSNTIAGAALDVFELEPLPLDDPHRTHPRLLATPHLGYVTRSNYTTYYRDAVEDISAFLAGQPIRVLA